MYKAVRELETNGRSGDPTPQNGLVNIREESTAARTLAKAPELLFVLGCTKQIKL